MDHVKQYEIPEIKQGGVAQRCVFGRGGYIVHGDGAMGYGEVLPGQEMKPVRHTKERVYYIAQASQARIQYGEKPDSLEQSCVLAQDDVLLLRENEWYRFVIDDQGGALKYMVFSPAPDAGTEEFQG